MYDIIIIGAGVTGCAVARYLSRYEGRMLVLEKAEDVCCGTSKANSAIVHAGFDAAHGSLMAKFIDRQSSLLGFGLDINIVVLGKHYPETFRAFLVIR